MQTTQQSEVPGKGSNVEKSSSRATDSTTVETYGGKYTRFVLENGLEVQLFHAPNANSILGEVVFRASSRSDHAELYGRAHFAEHLLGGATEAFPSRAAVLDSVKDHNIRLNAETSQDRLTVVAEGPAGSARLHAMLNALVECSFRSRFLPAEVEIQRRRIHQEYFDRMHTPHDQFGWGGEVYELIWPGNGLNAPTIGQLKTIAQISPGDLKNFADTHLRPDQATLILSGNLGNEVELEVRNLFGSLRSPVEPYTSPSPIQSRWTQGLGGGVHIKPFPGYLGIHAGIYFPAPAFGAADEPAFAVLMCMLSGLDSRSLMPYALETECGVTYSAATSSFMRRTGGQCSVGFTSSDSTAAQAGIAKVREVLGRISGGDLPEDLYQQAKSSILTKIERGQEENYRLAAARMSSFWVWGDGFRTFEDRATDIRQVTQSQVVDVAKRYFNWENRLLILTGDVRAAECADFDRL